MKSATFYSYLFSILFLIPNILSGQVPNLGSAESFALFTAVGAFSNDGTTMVTGDIGTNVGAFTGFPPGVVNGEIHVQNDTSAQAAIDVENAYMELSTVTCGSVLGVTLGNNQALAPNVYCIGAASTLEGNLILDGQCDPDAVFIFKIDGALATDVGSQVILTNGASLCNVYWQINGQVTLGENSVFRGTILANGAIILLEGATLFGRALSRSGAIELHNNVVDLDMQPTASVITADGAITFCEGDSVVLSGNCGGTWNTGDTTATITVTTSGNYFTTTTNACGSAVSNSIMVTVNLPPLCSITGELSFCVGGNTELCAPVDAESYLWSTGESTGCITASVAGIFSVTITDLMGCTSECSVEVTANPQPLCSITGDLSFCFGSSTDLCATLDAASYFWSTGETTSCISVSVAGTFSVTITDLLGCTSECSVEVTVDPQPLCTITGDLFLCEGQSTQLCATLDASSYLWSTGEITSCISVSAGGIFSVTITDLLGCTSECSVEVTANPQPICTITGDLFLCEGQSTQLCVPPGAASYLWSTGENTNCIDVSVAGIYSVTINDINGCTSECSVEVNVDPQPVCSITGDLSFCFGESTLLCVPTGAVSYLWSTGETTNCISASVEGTYSITVTYVGDCTSECSVEVTLNPLPLCSISGDLSLCLGGSTELCATIGAASYLWSTGETTSCISTSVAGIFSVTITDLLGCTSECTVEVTENPLPLCSITGDLSLCLGGSTELCALPGAVSYLWSTGETTSCISTSVAGIFSVTITDLLGCTSECSVEVILNPLPLCSITGGLSLCLGGSTELCATLDAESYLWSTGETTSCISTTIEGIFSVTITDFLGCTSECSVEVTVDPPLCTITGNPFLCLGESTQLCVPPGAVSYLWSTGESTNCITVDLAGMYSVTVTYLDGCSSVCEILVTDTPPPVCTIIGEAFLCPGGSTELCTPPGAASYLWSNGEITNCISVDLAGMYSVTITYVGGCSSICDILVTDTPPPVCTILGEASFCIGGSTELCTPPGAASYLWSTGETTNCITVDLAGTYSVTITFVDGCSSICEIVVTENPAPECTITGDDCICDGETTELCATSGADSYLWSTGAVTSCITVSEAGTYLVTVTFADGCISVCSRTVINDLVPVITCPLDVTVECDVSNLPVDTGTATATSDCDILPIIDFNDVITGEICPDEFEIVRTWTATTACGISSTCIQTLSVIDTGAPIITCPANITLDCEDLVPPVDLSLVVTSDNCGGTVTVTHIGDIVTDLVCVNSYTMARTYLATDACGNTSSCTQLITVTDNTPPEIAFDDFLLLSGDTIWVQCFGQDPNWDLPSFDEGSIIATDPCGGEVTVEFNQHQLSQGSCENGINNSFRLSWIATDNCGNSDSVYLTLALIDTIAPVIFNVPEDITINCNEVPPPPDDVYATDECLCVCLIVEQETTLDPGCMDGQVLLRTWTVNDGCGNQSTATQTITLVDDTGPGFVILQPELFGITNEEVLVYSCAEGGIPTFFGEIRNAVFLDSSTCGNSTLLYFNIDTLYAADCEAQGFVEQRTYNWIATDNCGNMSSLTIYARLIDDVAPVFSGIQDTACINVPIDVSATDDCGPVMIEFEDFDIPNPCGNGVAVQRIYQAFDVCGNVSRDTSILIPNDQTLPVIEFTNPILSALSDGEILIVDCAMQNGLLTAFGIEDVHVEGACGGMDVTFTEEMVTLGDCTENGMVATLELRWTATDICGNSNMRIVIANIMDESPPVFVDFLPEVSMGCNDEMPQLFATDKCGEVIIQTISENIIYGDCIYEYEIQRLVMATDECANSTTLLQTIHVGNTDGPTFEGIDDVLCNDTDIPEVTAYDACAGEFTDVTMEADTLDSPCGMIIERTWTATDKCGNTATGNQIVIANDSISPVFDIQFNSVIYSYMHSSYNLVFMSEIDEFFNLNRLDSTSVFVRDNCGQTVHIDFTVDTLKTEDCLESGFLENRIYTWIATDICGNSTTLSFNVNIVDDVPPVLVGVPEDITTVCEPLPANTTPVFSEDAGPVTIVFSETTVPGDMPGTFIVTRNWTATDACGNVSVYTQTITWIPDPIVDCNILLPPVVECNSHNVPICVGNSDDANGNSYNWEVVGRHCFIQSNPDSNCILIYIGWSPVEIILTTTDTFGCVTTCVTTMDCELALDNLSPDVFSGTDLDSDLTTGITTEGNPTDLLKNFQVYPNPSSGNLNVSFESYTENEVEINFMNLLGERILRDKMNVKKGFNSNMLNVSHVPDGRYLMQVITENEMQTKVVIIVRNH